MKIKNILMIIVFLSLLGCHQIKYGKYVCVIFKTGPIWVLNLNENHTFQFKIHNDLDYWGRPSNGYWNINKDTLIIKSYEKTTYKTFYLSNIAEGKLNPKKLVYIDFVDSLDKKIVYSCEIWDTLFINNKKISSSLELPDPDDSTYKNLGIEFDKMENGLKLGGLDEKRLRIQGLNGEKIHRLYFTNGKYKYIFSVRDSSSNYFKIILSSNEINLLKYKCVDMKFIIKEDSLKWIYNNQTSEDIILTYKYK